MATVLYFDFMSLKFNAVGLGAVKKKAEKWITNFWFIILILLTMLIKTFWYEKKRKLVKDVLLQ
jgi:hypothetical protein